MIEVMMIYKSLPQLVPSQVNDLNTPHETEKLHEVNDFSLFLNIVIEKECAQIK